MPLQGLDLPGQLQEEPILKTVFIGRDSGDQCPLAYWGLSTKSVQQSWETTGGTRQGSEKQAKFRSQDRGHAQCIFLSTASVYLFS